MEALSGRTGVVCGILLVFCALLAGCTGRPEGVQPVQGFEKGRYLGKWYEIARLDHSFEEGLSRVTAEYAARDDGGIDVTNRGYSAEDEEWSQATGRAYFVGDDSIGHLKVSFFGPFYGSYIVFELGEDYDYAFVSGPDKSYLWLLARSAQVEPALLEAFIARSEALGFDTSKLIFVDHPTE